MKNSMKEIKHIVGAVLVLLGLLAAYGFLFFMMKKEVSGAAELLLREENASNEAKKIRELEKTLGETEEMRGKISSYFVKKSEAVSFIESIERLGGQSGLSLSLKNASVADKTNVFRLDASTEGSFGNTMYFLVLLENLPNKISVEKAEIRKEERREAGAEEGKESAGAWSGSFVLALESFVN